MMWAWIAWSSDCSICFIFLFWHLGTYVEGIKEEVVLSPGHALSFITAGEEHHHVGSNNFNLFSSGSHTIFTLKFDTLVDGSLLIENENKKEGSTMSSPRNI
ncbi:kinesin-like protein KIN-7K, chloroplastic [Arachis stenosperma]|uniref:kinesin-like protein KIN-7K, chloroplastic n=1 Tax=Arachis stenosperma TaxID=217475 RepID=UPI0025AD634E|nr:kinesin-like protein KIN-7K, chloroplastic [Arachis stenosperma]